MGIRSEKIDRERMKTDDARVGEEGVGVGRWPVAGQRRGEVEALDDWVIC